MAGFFSTINRQMPQTIWYHVFEGYGSLEYFATSWTNLDNQYFSVNTSISVMGRVSGWTLSNSYSLKTPPTSTIGNLTLRTRCQSSKIPTAHLFLYLVDLGTALLTQSSSSSIVFGKRNLLRPWQKQHLKYFKFTTFLEHKFGVTRNYWIIINKRSQIQWMPTEKDKSHIQGILKKNGKNTTLHNFVLFLWRSHFKNSCFGFHRVSKRSKTIKPLGLRPCGFKCFLAFGHPMKPSHSFLK